MKVRDIMSQKVIRIGHQEPAQVAARTLTHYNIGMLPVCGGDGRLCGVITDRDLVTRCLAAERAAGTWKVSDVMSSHVISVGPDADLAQAAELMGKHQIRRLPVVENGRLCGMVTLADLANAQPGEADPAKTLMQITSNICRRER